MSAAVAAGGVGDAGGAEAVVIAPLRRMVLGELAVLSAMLMVTCRSVADCGLKVMVRAQLAEGARLDPQVLVMAKLVVSLRVVAGSASEAVPVLVSVTV